MGESKEIKIVLDEKMMLRIGLGIGYGFGALLRGIRQGLEDYEIEEAARESQKEETEIAEMRKQENSQKTEISDCRKCWCDQCARLEECTQQREGVLSDGMHPLPCLECGDGMRFKPLEEAQCEDFMQGNGVNNG